MSTYNWRHVEEQTLSDIIDLEWAMFHEVQSLDGPAACQQDPRTFRVMRSSQLASWNQEVAASYLDDLKKARDRGRNLMTEKYARMMEYTAPCEYRRIAPNVRAVDQEAAPLIERLSDLSVRSMEELVAKYPRVGGQGRPVRAWDDDRYNTSFETYNRGELSTYSVNTLQLLEAHYLELVADGINPAQLILEHTVTSQGLPSLEAAEAALEARARRAAQSS